MCAASPAKKSRPYCIGSITKLRIPVMPFCKMGPSAGLQPSLVACRVQSSSQILASGHRAISSSGAHCRYSRVIWGDRMLNSAKPRS